MTTAELPAARPAPATPPPRPGDALLVARSGPFRLLVPLGQVARVHPAALHLALVGSLVFFLATEKARRRAIDAGVLPPMPDFPEYLRYVEELTLRGLAPDRPSPVRSRKGAHA